MKNNELKIKLLQSLKNDIIRYKPNNIELVASGRTSIDFAIKDIIQDKKNVKKALLPNYICDSMIEPFEKNSISYDFYSIEFNNGKFVANFDEISSDNYDVIMICDYFYHDKDLYESIANIKNKDASIIHDATHTLFSNNTTFSKDDYIVCSLRKWFVTTDGGLVIKNGTFNIDGKDEHSKYIYYKTKSREYKSLYYNGENTNDIKKKYKLYSELAEKCLEKDFSLYGMSSETEKKLLNIDFEGEMKERQKYYELIKTKISSSSIIHNLDGTTMDNCLFTLPIIVDKNRDKVLELLYDNRIRCAILWEPTDKNKNTNNEFISKSICLDMTEDTNKKIDKVLKKVKEMR